MILGGSVHVRSRNAQFQGRTSRLQLSRILLSSPRRERAIPGWRRPAEAPHVHNRAPACYLVRRVPTPQKRLAAPPPLSFLQENFAETNPLPTIPCND